MGFTFKPLIKNPLLDGIKGFLHDFSCDWFLNHYKEFGFDNVIPEGTAEYFVLKKILNIQTYPDFFAIKNGKILKVEVESLLSHYWQMHPENYADVVICFEIDQEPYKPTYSVIEVRRHLSAEEDRKIYRFLSHCLERWRRIIAWKLRHREEVLKRFSEDMRMI